MFEPENDIERMLLRASAEPAARPGFARALMDAEIFLVLISEDGQIVTGPDGRAVIPEGTRLTLASVVRGEEKLLPLFTAPSRARSWFKGDHVVAPERTRDLFGRFPDAPYALNPGSDFARDFTPGEVQRMLAGLFDEGPQTCTTEAPEKSVAGSSRRNSRGLGRGAPQRARRNQIRARGMADACDAGRPASPNGAGCSASTMTALGTMSVARSAAPLPATSLRGEYSMPSRSTTARCRPLCAQEFLSSP
jgi:SseB protein N-terminal domain